MNTVELIKKKRDGKSLTASEIEFLINGYTRGKIPDYQISAFLMAGYCRGFNEEETWYITNAMLNSGITVELSDIPGAKIDKHSTGGVGDKTSLILTPIVASAGVKVPMISGRGLGHTGGTLDKLEAIPGFKTDLSLSSYKRVLKKCGAVLIGQTKQIAPADKMLYALRDVTATVESIPLITGSIMSKKLAEGIDGLVLDVKTGTGAFMKTLRDAKALARSLIETAKAFDKKVLAFITDMNQPLGNYIGNWLEVYESVQVLRGEVENDLSKLSVLLAGAMIYLGGKANSVEEGEDIAREMISSGKAFEKFKEIVKCQGGDVSYIENPNKYPKSRFKKVVKAKSDGRIAKMDTYEIGIAALELGAGRKTKEDKIDPKAGIIIFKKIGDKVKSGEVVAELYGDNKKALTNASERFYSALVLTNGNVKRPKLVKEIIK